MLAALADQDLRPEEMAAWRPFVTAASTVIGALDAELNAAFGISFFDHALLVLLSEQRLRRARMTDIARSLRVDPSNVTYRVRRLERMGLVERVPGTDDARVTYARITIRGLRLLRDAWPVHRAGIRRHFLDHVTAEQLPVIKAVFEAVTRALSR